MNEVNSGSASTSPGVKTAQGSAVAGPPELLLSFPTKNSVCGTSGFGGASFGCDKGRWNKENG